MDPEKTPAAKSGVSLKREKGFALTLTLALLPLLITALLGVAALFPFFSKLTRAEDRCRSGTLTTQKVLLEGLENLTKMSQLNERLYHLEMKALELVKASALHPAALKAALALLRSVRTSQQAMNLAQLSLIDGVELHARQTLARTAHQILESQQHLGVSYMASPLHTQGSKLQVEKSRKGSSDIYSPSKNFEEVQKIFGTWSLRPLPHFGLWTKNFFPELKNIHLRCGAGVERKGEKWEPSLLGVRRQLKSFGWSF